MIDGIRIKLCGLTSLVDAEFADRAGVDYLGFNLYPKSPRFLPLAQFRAMAGRLDGRKKVAVMVAPGDDELAAAMDAGFDRFQLHFDGKEPVARVKAWSQRVGRERLWLAPKLPPETDLSPALAELAGTVLFDTFDPQAFGGSGRTGDWGKFSRHRVLYPGHTWILAGGLNPDNIGEALRQSGAKVVDVNSGVETAPGLKDHAKLTRFMVAIHRARGGG